MSSIKSLQRSPLLVLALLTAVVLLALPAPRARADVTSTIIQRCAHGQTPTGFSQAAYRKALHDLPTEVGEYSDCLDLIHRAELATATGTASHTSPSGATASPGTTGVDSAGAPLATPITPRRAEGVASRPSRRGDAGAGGRRSGAPRRRARQRGVGVQLAADAAARVAVLPAGVRGVDRRQADPRPCPHPR